MADEREWKIGVARMEEDFSVQTTAAIEKAQELVKDGKVADAVETLLAMEKTTRLGGDTKSTQRLAKEVIDTLVEARDWERLLEEAELLMKRRGQMKQVQSVVVQAAVKAVDLAPTKEVKVQLIQKLRGICEGKLHVELEYARLTVQLADIWDADGNLKDATELMQRLQVETIGNMEKPEKFDIILQQVEMSLRMEDYTIANILYKKIPMRTLDKSETLRHKVRYHQLLIRYFTHFENHFMISKQYYELYATVFRPEFKPEEVSGQYATVEAKLQVLQLMLVYLFLSPYNAVEETLEEEVRAAAREKEKAGAGHPTVDINTNQKLALLTKVEAEKRLEELPEFQALVKCFTTLELLSWENVASKHAALKEMSPFKEKPERWEVLHKRIIEHNIRVIAAYYRRLTLERLAELVGMPPDDTEEFLCTMVSDKLVSARVNRMDKTVSFIQSRSKEQHLNQWADGVAEVLALLGTTCHLITKEQMVHQARQEKARALSKMDTA
jgi:26S proteasome regulatory subunit N5